MRHPKSSRMISTRSAWLPSQIWFSFLAGKEYTWLIKIRSRRFSHALCFCLWKFESNRIWREAQKGIFNGGNSNDLTGKFCWKWFNALQKWIGLQFISCQQLFLLCYQNFAPKSLAKRPLTAQAQSESIELLPKILGYCESLNNL